MSPAFTPVERHRELLPDQASVQVTAPRLVGDLVELDVAQREALGRLGQRVAELLARVGRLGPVQLHALGHVGDRVGGVDQRVVDGVRRPWPRDPPGSCCHRSHSFTGSCRLSGSSPNTSIT